MVSIAQDKQPYTAEDLQRLPDDGKRYEVIREGLVCAVMFTQRSMDCTRIDDDLSGVL